MLHLSVANQKSHRAENMKVFKRFYSIGAVRPSPQVSDEKSAGIATLPLVEIFGWWRSLDTQ